MAYSTPNSEITAYTGLTYSTSSDPTLSAVTNIITQIDAEIDTALKALGLTVPVTNTTLTGLAGKYSAMGAAGIVLRRFSKNDTDASNADWLYGKFEAWIDKLTKDEDYQDSIKTMNGSFTGFYVGSNFTDGTHTGASVKEETVQYGIEGFKK